MGISLRPEHLKRYAQIARLLMKYGRSDLVKQSGLDNELADDPDLQLSGDGPRPEDLATDLEAMGPTFIKLGQLLSTRVDLLPAPYTEALSRLQDDVEPFPFEEVERDHRRRSSGVRISKAFREFDPEPIAAASLGQVHRGRLRDGRPVAVKVQRPGIREQVIGGPGGAGGASPTFLDAHTEIGAALRSAPACSTRCARTLLTRARLPPGGRAT